MFNLIYWSTSLVINYGVGGMHVTNLHCYAKSVIPVEILDLKVVVEVTSTIDILVDV